MSKSFLIVAVLAVILSLSVPIMPEEWFDQMGEETGNNFVIVGNKVVPLTKLSDEDAKRPCGECHGGK